MRSTPIPAKFNCHERTAEHALRVRVQQHTKRRPQRGCWDETFTTTLYRQPVIKARNTEDENHVLSLVSSPSILRVVRSKSTEQLNVSAAVVPFNITTEEEVIIGKRRMSVF